MKNGNFWDTVYRQGAKNGTKYGFKTDACTRGCDHPEAPQTIEPGERCVFPSGLAAEIPAGTAGFVFTRSGLGIKKGIHVTNGVGVIDSDYRGEIQIGLHNLSAEPYTVQPGERIAQMIIMPYFAPVIEEVTSLTETDRGAGGFGSTGTK